MLANLGHRALVEQIQLAILAAIGFKRHQRDTQGTRFLNHQLHQRTRHRLQQVQVVPWLTRTKPAILLKHIREEVTQTPPPAKIFLLTGPTQRDCLRRNHLQQFSERNVLKSNYFSAEVPGRREATRLSNQLSHPSPPGV